MGMVVGDLLARFGDDFSATEAILGLADLKLVARLRQQAAGERLGLGAFAAVAVRRYADEASDEEWVTLMGELARSADPSLAFIRRALSHATRAPT